MKTVWKTFTEKSFRNLQSRIELWEYEQEIRRKENDQIRKIQEDVMWRLHGPNPRGA